MTAVMDLWSAQDTFGMAGWVMAFLFAAVAAATRHRATNHQKRETARWRRDALMYRRERDAAYRRLRTRPRPIVASRPRPGLPRRPAPSRQRLPIHDLAEWPDTVQMPTIVTRQLEAV